MFNSGKDGFEQRSEYDSNVSYFGEKRDSVTDIIADIGASIGKFLESIKIKIV